MERNLPELLTIKTASEAMGISARTIRCWAYSDRSFPAVKIRGRVFIKKYEFNRWLKLNSEPAAL